MKRSTSAIALIAGLMMSLFGAVAHAGTPCPPAPGYMTSNSNMDNMSKSDPFENTWVELSQYE